MDLESEAAQRVGTTLCNKWTLDRLIGTGGMAAVYVATHKIGRREAIKILHSDVARDPELRARFEQEANAVNSFKHPGAVEVRDIDVAEDGSPFLVMELLDGRSLSDLAKQPGGMELAEILRMVDEMLDVLVAAHAQGIIHRDIKPDNLFVLQDGRLKVLDFGIARMRAGAPPKLRTRVGATLGTAPYMPPEQIHGAEIDARADIFAVGATMFRVIARRRVHEAESETETLIKMASLPAPPLATAAPDAPRDVCLVVDRALQFDREQRYPDAVTMQRDVRALREGRPPPYATARLDAGEPSAAQPVTAPATAIVIPPSSASGAVTPDLARIRAELEDEATSAATPQTPATPAAPMGDGPTRAASPIALQAPDATGQSKVTADAITLPRAQSPLAPITLGTNTPPPNSMRVPNLDYARDPPAPPADMSLLSVPQLDQPGEHPRAPADDPATRPAMMVLGAAGLGAPLKPAGSPSISSVAGLPPPPPLEPRPGERTLRSMLGPEGSAGHGVAPQGYAVATTVMPQAHEPASTPGPRTQLSGMAVVTPPVPSAPLAPGESIPVMPAPPPPPRRRRTLPGTEISVWPLVAVGLIFATIGVAVTLYFMLREPNPADMSTYPVNTSPEPRATVRPTAHVPSVGPLLTPSPPTKGPVRHPK